MDKQAIVEQVAREHYQCYEEATAKGALNKQVELILTAANYFDLLEAARVKAMQDKYTTCQGRTVCNECGRLWSNHKHNCSTGALVEVLRKAGVKVE